MRAEVQTIADSIKQSLELLRRHLDYDAATRRLDELNALSEDPDLWNDSARAQKLMRERTHLESAIGAYRETVQEYEDAIELIDLAEAEGDDDVRAEGEAALTALEPRVEKRRIESLLSGEADHNDAFLEIHAGAGGTDAQDFAEMLARMYVRWSDAHGYKVEWIEESEGGEAGIKSATVKVGGHNAYGWLKTETGTHRLVRISPFGAKRRETSFVAVGVYPVLEDDIDIEIDEKDLRIDVYRASGAGGQHVNKTESAVRITHIPTNIVVQCQNDRSQHKNRATAMKMLQARLYEAELRKREEAAQAEHEAKTDIGWGHQIRSYVLHPYQMVKDLRTGFETSDSQAVLDGDLDGFLQAALAERIAGGEEEEAAAEG
ncbi:MAG: peptide chain release factor 2 [Alphaproteobacteria bacterium]|nr:peptide chain release factor 2 [Alphaproteobacteria bacterium]